MAKGYFCRLVRIGAALLLIAPVRLLAQQTPQAQPLSSGACKLDGSAGCGGGGGSGDVTSVAITANNGISGSNTCASGACAFTLGLGALTATSFTFDGTGGAGFIDLSGQASAPSAPTGIVRLYADNLTGDLKFKLTSTTGTYWHSGNLVIGTDVQAYDADLAALAGNSTDGLWAHTGAGTGSARTITGTANEVSVANGSGAGGNPTVSLASALDLSGKTLQIPGSTTVPGSCSGSEIYMDTDATSGQRIYGCESGVFVLQGGGASGANTALSNLASVAINAALATGAGTNATLSATAPAAAASTTAGASANLTASAATAGTTNAGAAAGGQVNITAGSAARLTSGNANGGDIILSGGTGIGSGRRGTVSAPAVGSLCEVWGLGATSTGNSATLLGNGASGGNSNSVVVIGTSASGVGGNSSTVVGASASGGATNATVVGASSACPYASVALGKSAACTAAAQLVVGGSTSGAAYINDAYIGSGVTDSSAKSIVMHATGGSGTNNAGGNYTIAGGIGTGTAAGGSVRVQTTPSGASGSSANTLADRFVFAAKQVTLTESTDTLVLNAGVASGTVAGGVLWYTIRADDGTDFQVLRGRILWSGVNKAGTVTTTLGTAEEITTTSTGTLTNTVTAVANGNSIDLKLNAVSSLTQTTLYAFVSSQMDGQGVFTTQ